MIRLLASWSQGVRGISATRCQDRGLSCSECILDGPSEREAQILAAEGTPEVIQVQGPHHGTGQLPASQVLHLAFDALLVIIPHPLVALGGIGDLLAKESMDRGSAEEVTDLSREQGRGGVGAVLRPCRSQGGGRGVWGVEGRCHSQISFSPCFILQASCKSM